MRQAIACVSFGKTEQEIIDDFAAAGVFTHPGFLLFFYNVAYQRAAFVRQLRVESQQYNALCLASRGIYTGAGAAASAVVITFLQVSCRVSAIKLSEEKGRKITPLRGLSSFIPRSRKKTSRSCCLLFADSSNQKIVAGMAENTHGINAFAGCILPRSGQRKLPVTLLHFELARAAVSSAYTFMQAGTDYAVITAIDADGFVVSELDGMAVDSCEQAGRILSGSTTLVIHMGSAVVQRSFSIKKNTIVLQSPLKLADIISTTRTTDTPRLLPAFAENSTGYRRQRSFPGQDIMPPTQYMTPTLRLVFANRSQWPKLQTSGLLKSWLGNRQSVISIESVAEITQNGLTNDAVSCLQIPATDLTYGKI